VCRIQNIENPISDKSKEFVQHKLTHIDSEEYGNLQNTTSLHFIFLVLFDSSKLSLSHSFFSFSSSRHISFCRPGRARQAELAPEPPRATGSQPESIQTIISFFFELRQRKKRWLNRGKKNRVEPAQLDKKKGRPKFLRQLRRRLTQILDKKIGLSREKIGLSQLNPQFRDPSIPVPS